MQSHWKNNEHETQDYDVQALTQHWYHLPLDTRIIDLTQTNRSFAQVLVLFTIDFLSTTLINLGRRTLLLKSLLKLQFTLGLKKTNVKNSTNILNTWKLFTQEILGIPRRHKKLFIVSTPPFSFVTVLSLSLSVLVIYLVCPLHFSP